MKVRILLPYIDIRKACEKHKPVTLEVEVSSCDVVFVSLQELQEIIERNSYLVPLLLNYLKERWGE